MKLTPITCLLALGLSMAVLSQSKPQPKSTPTKAPESTPTKAPAKTPETKAPAPTQEEKELAKAYGLRKQFCCQMQNGCISGPRDGSQACKRLGGDPFSNSFCIALPSKPGEEKKGGHCVDP